MKLFSAKSFFLGGEYTAQQNLVKETIQGLNPSSLMELIFINEDGAELYLVCLGQFLKRGNYNNE